MLLSSAVAALPAAAQTPCGAWEVLPVPSDPSWWRAGFEDVAALEDGTIWAVGHATVYSPGTGGSGTEKITLAMRYAGGQWENTPTPYVAPAPGLASDSLNAVAALAPDDVWAAGYRTGDAGGLNVGPWLHVIHWDGSSWSVVPSPPPPGGTTVHFSGPSVEDIVAFARDDVWFLGLWGEPNSQATVTWRLLAMHWDGSSLSIEPTPALYSGSQPVHIHQAAGLPSGEIWAILRGNNSASGPTMDPMVVRYDGSSWTLVPTPSQGGSVVLSDIVAVAPDDIWVFGYRYYPPTPFSLHWDGSSFGQGPSVPFLSSATSLAADQIYLGGGAVHLFDGTNATLVEDFPGVSGASIQGLDSLPGCRVFAAGSRHASLGGGIGPFAARMRQPGSTFCAGDGSAAPCPCGNQGSVGHGCANGTFSQGAELSATGLPSLSADTLELAVGRSTLTQPGLFFQGDNPVAGGQGTPFGDGLRCVGGSVVRLQVLTTDAQGNAVTTIGLGVAGGVVAGETKHYQWWYRDPHASPCGQGFNLSNGLSVAWQP